MTARIAAIFILCVTAGSVQAFEPGTAPFRVQFGEHSIGYELLAVTVRPGEAVRVSVPEPRGREFQLAGSAGVLSASNPSKWQWTAPSEPGHYTLDLRRDDGVAIRIRAFVLTPFEEVDDGYLNGYRIGEYPRHPLRDNPIYLAPDGFIEVTREMLDLPVSPHFTLGQFLCKQQQDHWPKYLVLRTALLVKLELLLAEVNRRGIRTESFFIMSGFRTPAYNEAIGNVAYSRHLWGGAADVFIDEDGDGVMDDLNGDGRLDLQDAQFLQRVAKDLSENGVWRRLLGGLGLYGPRIHRGSFVHVDARGNKARWTVP